MSITSNSPESLEPNLQGLTKLKRALEGTEASLLYVKRKLDELAKNFELAHSCPHSRHEPNGFDWVRQLELAFSMISGAEVKVDKYFYSYAKQIVISIQTQCMDCSTVAAVSNLFRQVFEEKIVQDVSPATPHNKFGVA